ncbi:HD-GYP domain-containing protein [Peribacillus cavernae]|uniref:HD-GYP domain-containing protein n=1 Tax=Peribacillus cavernae TaxID=1674310 RepID=A0A433HGV3_9BACI|nr:HD-GYP domain-containing protein [Peribacillus cavernae]MDQ0220436.1 putative nucleotidyltransferase with HDIG domain [Peribacillus cavernae]RUQ27548.1 HD-GYP domain-containing protein [Peribacillus cavernae]
MKGLKISKQGNQIDVVHQFSNELSLLSRDNGVDIMLQTIYKDKMFYIYPSENPDVLEFIYILNGEIECDQDEGKVTLTTRDYFTVKGLKEPVYFTAKTDVTYLWVITEPTFQQVSEGFRKLTDITKKVEAKDRYTFNHSERVATYSVKIAKYFKLPVNMVQKLFEATILHDIGKIKVPVEVLNKPDKLTEIECDLIKKHPGDGAEMVRETGYCYLGEIIEQHHERLDGSGYPYGLKGDEITFEAKIIAVCDTFDAMTEDRAYRKAYSAQFAMDELKSLAGIRYDEEIVRAFEKVLKDEGKIE